MDSALQKSILLELDTEIQVKSYNEALCIHCPIALRVEVRSGS